MWPPVSTTLVLSFKDHLLEVIKATERGEVEAGCSDMLKWAQRGVATGEWSWVTMLGSVQRCLKSQLGALLLTAGSTVMSILCPVWSPQQEEVQGMDKQDP